MRSLLVTAAVLAAALLVPQTASAAGATGAAANCPARKGTLAKNGIGRVWHRGKSLYACTTVYGVKPRTRRIGKYVKGVKVAFNGENAAYTVPRVRDGVGFARVNAINVNNGRRWLRGRKLIPATAGAPEQDAQVEKLALRDRSAAWVTKTGAVVLALQDPAFEPEPIGPLPEPPQVDGQLLLVGSFGGDSRAIADSLRYKQESGEGDVCGGVNPYTLTVQPDPAGERVGVRWDGYWSSTSDVCT